MKQILFLLLIIALFLVHSLAQDKQLKVVEYEIPKYPPAAVATRTQGDVIAIVKIDSEGNVKSVKVEKAHPLLRKVSEIAAKGWKFSRINENKERESQIIFSFQIKDKYNDNKIRTKFKKPNRVEIIAGRPQLSY